jgi:hypothetical protein
MTFVKRWIFFAIGSVAYRMATSAIKRKARRML